MDNIMKLTAENVTSVFMDSLFREEELGADGKPIDIVPIKVVGVRHYIGFHPERCRGHEQDVRQMLACLDNSFKTTGGCGMSFLRMCEDNAGNEWTGDHAVMDQLVCLGIALDLVTLTPRELNEMLPGGMPYVTVNF